MPKSHTYNDVVTADFIKEVSDEIRDIIIKRVTDFGNTADRMALMSSILSYTIESTQEALKCDVFACAVCNTIRAVKHAHGSCPFGDIHIRLFKKEDGE